MLGFPGYVKEIYVGKKCIKTYLTVCDKVWKVWIWLISSGMTLNVFFSAQKPSSLSELRQFCKEEWAKTERLTNEKSLPTIT